MSWATYRAPSSPKVFPQTDSDSCFLQMCKEPSAAPGLFSYVRKKDL